MSKVEDFIKDYTRNCSNVFINPQLGGTEENHPWLTPDDARTAVEIAREEVIEKSANWMKLYVLNHDEIDIFEMEEEYKKYMEE